MSETDGEQRREDSDVHESIDSQDALHKSSTMVIDDIDLMKPSKDILFQVRLALLCFDSSPCSWLQLQCLTDDDGVECNNDDVENC